MSPNQHLHVPTVACYGIIFIVQTKINTVQCEGNLLTIFHIALLFADGRTAALIFNFDLVSTAALSELWPRDPILYPYLNGE